MVDELGRVADAGADYVRVDARLRKPEHVQSMVKAYREVIDGRVDSFEAKKRLRGWGPPLPEDTSLGGSSSSRGTMGFNNPVHCFSLPKDRLHHDALTIPSN